MNKLSVKEQIELKFLKQYSYWKELHDETSEDVRKILDEDSKIGERKAKELLTELVEERLIKWNKEYMENEFTAILMVHFKTDNPLDKKIVDACNIFWAYFKTRFVAYESLY